MLITSLVPSLSGLVKFSYFPMLISCLVPSLRGAGKNPATFQILFQVWFLVLEGLVKIWLLSNTDFHSVSQS